MDVARAADVLLRGLRHEGRRDPVQERDLLDPVLVDRVAVGGGDRVGVARVDLVLAVPGLALRELDRDPGGVHPAADRAEVLLVHRRREDVVVEDVGDRRREVAVVLLVGLGVALLVEVELELGGELRRVAHLPRRARTAAISTWRGEATTGEPSWLTTSQRTSAVRSSHGIRRSVAMSGAIAEVAVALLPVGHLVAGHRLHLHVEGEQVVAALDPVLDDLVEEVLDLDPLAEQPPLHVGEGGDDRVDRARLGLLAEVVERRASRRCRPGRRAAAALTGSSASPRLRSAASPP